MGLTPGTAVRAAAVGLLTAAAFAGAVPDAAFAGSNGQQVHFIDRRGDVRSVKLVGHNQNGSWVSHCFAVVPGSDTRLTGWWWKDDVEVIDYTGAQCGGEVVFQGIHEIPARQPGDWYEITD
ncbi:hypothetical protein [Streptomyces sp. NPDC001678]|uniref:hypothetical protein n=1 Tax=Streptomyces sp. NPDC001678 TaxID=3364599 RepID=UPI0036B49B71